MFAFGGRKEVRRRRDAGYMDKFGVIWNFFSSFSDRFSVFLALLKHYLESILILLSNYLPSKQSHWHRSPCLTMLSQISVLGRASGRVAARYEATKATQMLQFASIVDFELVLVLRAEILTLLRSFRLLQAVIRAKGPCTRTWRSQRVRFWFEQQSFRPFSSGWKLTCR